MAFKLTSDLSSMKWMKGLHANLDKSESSFLVSLLRNVSAIQMRKFWMDGLRFWNIAPVCLCLRKCLSDFELLWEDICETETWVINVSNSGFHCIFYRELYVWLIEMAVVSPMHDFTGMSINTHGGRRLNGSQKDCHVCWASQRNPEASIQF